MLVIERTIDSTDGTSTTIEPADPIRLGTTSIMEQEEAFMMTMTAIEMIIAPCAPTMGTTETTMIADNDIDLLGVENGGRIDMVRPIPGDGAEVTVEAGIRDAAIDHAVGAWKIQGDPGTGDRTVCLHQGESMSNLKVVNEDSIVHLHRFILIHMIRTSKGKRPRTKIRRNTVETPLMKLIMVTLAIDWVKRMTVLHLIPAVMMSLHLDEAVGVDRRRKGEVGVIATVPIVPLAAEVLAQV